MLDMSFSEIAVIGVVALVVLGPERLPKVARTAGHLFGRLQRYVATVKADINREIDTSELAKIKQEVQDAAKSFEHSVQHHASSVEKETVAISQSVDLNAPLTAPLVPTPSTQSDLLAQQAEGLGNVSEAPVDAKSSIPAVSLERKHALGDADGAIQATLDFGIEPVRIAKST